MCLLNSIHIYLSVYEHACILPYITGQAIHGTQVEPQRANVFNLSSQKAIHPLFTTYNTSIQMISKQIQTPRSPNKNRPVPFAEPKTTEPGHSNPHFPFARWGVRLCLGPGMDG